MEIRRPFIDTDSSQWWRFFYVLFWRLFEKIKGGDVPQGIKHHFAGLLYYLIFTLLCLIKIKPCFVVLKQGFIRLKQSFKKLKQGFKSLK